MSTVTLRVRPGFTHGAQKEYKGGDLLFVDAAEAAMLLAAFGDKLEQVGEAYEPAAEGLDVVEETPGLQEGRPGGRRSQGSRRSRA